MIHSRPPLCTVYRVLCRKCTVVTPDGPAAFAFSGTWVEEEADSAELREKIVAAIAAQIGATKLRVADVDIHVTALGPRFAVGESKIESGPLRKVPTGSARVLLEMSIAEDTQARIERCNRFEEELDAILQRAGVGHVDGNEIGQGLYTIYCHGPQKQPLREAVICAARLAEVLDWRISR